MGAAHFPRKQCAIAPTRPCSVRCLHMKCRHSACPQRTRQGGTATRPSSARCLHPNRHHLASRGRTRRASPPRVRARDAVYTRIGTILRLEDVRVRRGSHASVLGTVFASESAPNCVSRTYASGVAPTRPCSVRCLHMKCRHSASPQRTRQAGQPRIRRRDAVCMRKRAILRIEDVRVSRRPHASAPEASFAPESAPFCVSSTDASRCWALSCTRRKFFAGAFAGAPPSATCAAYATCATMGLLLLCS